MFLLKDVSCGSITIDSIIPGTISTVVNIIKIAVPIMLIVFGILDMAKAVIANKEDEMKNAQKLLIKRVIYAVIVFFVVALVQFVFGQLAKASDGETNSATSCISCFINGNCN